MVGKEHLSCMFSYKTTSNRTEWKSTDTCDPQVSFLKYFRIKIDRNGIHKTDEKVRDMEISWSPKQLKIILRNSNILKHVREKLSYHYASNLQGNWQWCKMGSDWKTFTNIWENKFWNNIAEIAGTRKL